MLVSPSLNVVTSFVLDALLDRDFERDLLDRVRDLLDSLLLLLRLLLLLLV